jgi:hypothetical protein
MKLLIALIFVCAVTGAVATPRTFEWNANAPEELVLKYCLYEQLGPGWTKIGETTGTTLVHDIAPGPHVYTVTAVNLGGESERGAPLTWTEPAPVTPPTGLRVAIQITASLTVGPAPAQP